MWRSDFDPDAAHAALEVPPIEDDTAAYIFRLVFLTRVSHTEFESGRAQIGCHFAGNLAGAGTLRGRLDAEYEENHTLKFGLASVHFTPFSRSAGSPPPATLTMTIDTIRLLNVSQVFETGTGAIITAFVNQRLTSERMAETETGSGTPTTRSGAGSDR
ncbi:MAG: hypothetical protein OER77_16300 [Myxococcales bacterium]|nr:hypothetical protein [Myxococcales bacterium]